MATPDDEKSPAVVALRDRVARDLFGNTLPRARSANACISCGGSMSAEQFRDEASFREAEISQLCQKCQDDVFGEEDDDA